MKLKIAKNFYITLNKFMPRVTKALAAKAKHKEKVLTKAKRQRSRLFRTAKQSNIKALQYAF